MPIVCLKFDQFLTLLASSLKGIGIPQFLQIWLRHNQAGTDAFHLICYVIQRLRTISLKFPKHTGFHLLQQCKASITHTLSINMQSPRSNTAILFATCGALDKSEHARNGSVTASWPCICSHRAHTHTELMALIAMNIATHEQV